MPDMENTKKPGIGRRAVVGVGKAWAYSLGFTGLARELGRIGGNVVAAGGYVRRKLQDGPQNYRHEIFQDAVDRLGLDDAHLVRQARAFNTRAFSWLAAMLLATAWLAGAAWSDAPLAHAVLCLGAIFMTFSKAITFRFRFCQIRDRSLYAFFSWFSDPSRW